MNAKNRPLMVWAATIGFCGVAAGAFAAHGISAPQPKAWLQTGTQYALPHTLAALACLNLAHHDWRTRPAAWAFLIGASLFAASLYLMAFTGWLWLGAVTPLGGLGLLAGWVLLGVGALRGPSAPPLPTSS